MSSAHTIGQRLYRQARVICVSAFAIATTVTLSACGREPPKSPAQLLAAATPQVTVLQVIQRSTLITSDAVGEVKAFREVELRARANGLIDKVYFKPGQRVEEGDVLFRIDPQQYQAAIDDKRAAVAEAEAALARAKHDVERYRPLVPDNPIPKQTFDQAVAQAEQQGATVASRRAALDKAELDLGYTRVRSPVSGQIGLQKVEEGTYVAAGTTPLAVVSTLDPVYVYFNVAETDYVAFAKKHIDRIKSGSMTGQRPIEILLPDGSPYAHDGEIDFAERAFASTGTLSIRAKFPNPDHLLRPGLNVRVRINREFIDNALLVPQRAVGDLLGKQFVFVVGNDNNVEQRMVALGERIGELWLVREGLKPGERIVVDGVHKARSGAAVQPTMLSESQLSAATANPLPPRALGALAAR